MLSLDLCQLSAICLKVLEHLRQKPHLPIVNNFACRLHPGRGPEAGFHEDQPIAS